MSKKMLMALIISCVSFSIFAGSNNEKTMDGPKMVTIKIAYPIAVDAPISKILEGYAAEFMAQHDNITIETVYAGGYADVKTMIQTSIDGGGDTPALAVMLATDIFNLANAEYVTPIGSLIDQLADDKYLNDFIPAFMSNSYYMDDLWSLPFQRSAVLMYYNKDLLASEGLTTPQNWDDLAKTAQALTVTNNGETTRWGIEWPSGWPYWLFQPLAIGAGQNIVGKSDTEVYFNTPEVIEAINYYISLSKNYNATPAGVQGSWGNVVPNFLAENTAFIIHSSGSMTGILKDAKFNVGVMGIPGKNGKSYSVPGGGNLYVTKGLTDAQARASVEFAIFLTSPEKVANFSINTGYIATRGSAFDTKALRDYISVNPQAGEARGILENAGKELAVQNFGEVRNIFHKYIQAAYNGEMTADEAMKKAQTEAEKALADFK